MVEATGRSGLLPGAVAEVLRVPVGKIHHNDLDRSLRNLALGVPGPGSVPAGLSVEPPHNSAHAFWADPLAVRSDQVSAALLPAEPIRARIGVTVYNALVVRQRAGILLLAVLPAWRAVHHTKAFNDPLEGVSARAGPFRNQRKSFAHCRFS